MHVTVIPGVGPATAERLRRVGHPHRRRARGASASTSWSGCVGKAHGHGLYALARADDDRPSSPERETKSVSVEGTYDTDLTDRRLMEGLLTRQAGDVAERLRKHGLSGRTVTHQGAAPRLHDAQPLHDAGLPHRPRRDRSPGSPAACWPTSTPPAASGCSASASPGSPTGSRRTCSATSRGRREDEATERARGRRCPRGTAPALGARAWTSSTPSIGRGLGVGLGRGVVTVRFETARRTGPGPVRSFADDDPRAQPAGADPGAEVNRTCVARPQLGAAAEVGGGHHRDHRVAARRRVVGAGTPRGRPSGGHLHGAEHHPLAGQLARPRARGSAAPSSRSPTRLESAVHDVRRPRRAAAQRRRRRTSRPAAPAPTRSGPVPRGVAGVSSGARRLRAATRPAAPSPAVDRRRPEPRPACRSTASPAPAPRRCRRRPRRRPARRARAGPDLDRGAGRHRDRLGVRPRPARRRRDLAAGAPVTATRQAPGRSRSRPPGASSPGPPRPAARCRPAGWPARPPAVERARRAARRGGPARAGRRSWTVVRAPSAARRVRRLIAGTEPDPGPGGSSAGGSARGVPQRGVGVRPAAASRRATPSGRRRYHRPASADRAGRHPGARGVEPRHGAARSGSPAQVGEAGREAAERDDELRSRRGAPTTSLAVDAPGVGDERRGRRRRSAPAPRPASPAAGGASSGPARPGRPAAPAGSLDPVEQDGLGGRHDLDRGDPGAPGPRGQRQRADRVAGLDEERVLRPSAGRVQAVDDHGDQYRGEMR